MIDIAGWRKILTVNLHVAAKALLRTWRRAPLRVAHLDPVGALLATGALGLLTNGLVVGAGTAGWIGPVAAKRGARRGAPVRVRRLGRAAAMMTLALFASRDFVGLTLFTPLLYDALGALFLRMVFGIMRV